MKTFRRILRLTVLIPHFSRLPVSFILTLGKLQSLSTAFCNGASLCPRIFAPGTGRLAGKRFRAGFRCFSTRRFAASLIFRTVSHSSGVTITPRVASRRVQLASGLQRIVPSRQGRKPVDSSADFQGGRGYRKCLSPIGSPIRADNTSGSVLPRPGLPDRFDFACLKFFDVSHESVFPNTHFLLPI